MSRTVVLVAAVLIAAVAVPSALADGGPSPGVSADGKKGLTDRRTGLTYTALSGTTDTFVVARDRVGRELRSTTVHGSWGIPFVSWSFDRGGLSHDGSRLVLAGPPAAGLARRSRFVVLDTASLRPVRRIDLRGDFAFDALSPDNRTLFLIQHAYARDLQRYRVRAYDLADGALESQAIVDKAEPNMAGMPLRRLVGPGARWVYTLYMHNTDYFVHALDTVHAQARCLDIPWGGNPTLMATGRLALRGERLAVVGRDGRTLTSIGLPAERRAAGLAAAGWAAVGSVAALAAAALLFRLRRRAKPA